MTDTVEIIDRVRPIRHNSKWVGERAELLRKLVANGLGQTAIAAQFSTRYNEVCTRNMIISAMMRLNLKCATQVHTPGKIKTTTSQRTQGAVQQAVFARQRGNSHAVAPVRLIDEPETHPDDLTIPLDQRKTLLELRNDSCRWPVGVPDKPDFFFCGDSGADLSKRRPYCTQHMRRALDPNRQGWKR